MLSSARRFRVMRKIFTSLKATVRVVGLKNIVPISYSGNAVIK
jgi:hypothetical protein